MTFCFSISLFVFCFCFHLVLLCRCICFCFIVSLVLHFESFFLHLALKFLRLNLSDTSGSLNFPTPISVKDITREFTANIRERCTLRSPLQPQPQRTITTTTTTAASAYVNLDPRTGGVVRMVLSPPEVDELQPQPHSDINNISSNSNIVVVEAVEKKPSYLNLACCVNGYSNLTTYDSKIRQDINKSREVSPIRPSTSSLQYCKRNNSLAAPVLHTMPLTKQPATTATKATPSKYSTLLGETNNNNNNNGSLKNGHLENGDLAYCNGSAATHGNSTTSSFIQQRVERLYGPGALAQGFYSPKKHRSSLSPVPRQHNKPQSQSGDELSRKFKQLSPSKDYGEFRKKLHNNCTQTATARSHSELAATTNGQNGDTDLPVFRHLSHEFRKQLPTVSPKRSVPRLSPAPEVLLPPLTNGSAKEPAVDVVDHEPVKNAELNNLERYNSTTKISGTPEPAPASTAAAVVAAVLVDVAAVVPAAEVVPAVPVAAPAAVPEKDGNYFLKILKEEQVRLLALAAVGEKYIDALTVSKIDLRFFSSLIHSNHVFILQNNPDITEDTFGLLRSASGKARLLVSQKMKQFEGNLTN